MTNEPTYNQGRNAAKIGLHPADNPFPAGSAQHEIWRAGWCDHITGTYDELERLRVMRWNPPVDESAGLAA